MTSIVGYKRVASEVDQSDYFTPQQQDQDAGPLHHGKKTQLQAPNSSATLIYSLITDVG